MEYPVAKYQQPAPSAPPTVVVETGKHGGWWQSLPDGTKRFVAVGGVVLATATIVGIAFLLARRAVRKQQADKSQTQSFGGTKEATWAKQLRQAFDNDAMFSWGTDEALIRRVMLEIPTKEDFDKVVKEYRKQTKGGNLITDMSDELSASEYQEMLAIKESKPSKANGGQVNRTAVLQGWAKRLHAAVNYHYWMGVPGTDDNAIKAVFQEMRTRKDFYDTAYWYRKWYSVSLWTDLDGDLDWSLDWRALLKKKPAK